MMEAFVNTDEPLATDVDVDTYLFGQPAVSVDFENVPIAKMVDIEAKFREVIDGIMEAGPEALDLDRYIQVVHIQNGGRFKFQACVYS